MPAPPLPSGAVCRLGTPSARRDLGGRLSLVPPYLRTFIAWDADIRGEYSLDDGSLLRRFLLPDGYGGDGSVSADGSRLMLSSPPAVVDRASGRAIFTLAGMEGDHPSFSADGRFVAVSLPGPRPVPRGPDDFLVADEGLPSRGIVLYSVDSVKLVWKKASPFGIVRRLHLSPSGRTLIVSEGRILWHSPRIAMHEGPIIRSVLMDGPIIRRLPDCEHLFEPFPAFTPDGNGLVYRQWRNDRIIDLKTGDVAPGPPAGAVYSPNGCFAAHLDPGSGELVRLDRWTGAVLDRTPCPFPQTQEAQDLRVRNDGVAVCLCRSGSSAMAWSAPDGRTTSASVLGRRPPGGVAFDASGREVVTRPGAATLDDPTTRRWDAATGALLGETPLPFPLLATAWEQATALPSGALYSSGDEAVYFDPLTGWVGEGRGRRIDAGEGHADLLRLSGRPVAARIDGTVTPVNDGTFVASWWEDKAARLVQRLRVDGTRCETLWSRALPLVQTTVRDRGSGRACPEWAVIRAYHGRALLVVHRRNVMPHLLDAGTGETRGVWRESIRPEPLAVHPNLPLVAAATGGGDSLAVFDAASGYRRATLLSACEPEALAWSPDGSRLVASLGDTTAVVFDLAHFLPAGKR